MINLHPKTKELLIKVHRRHTATMGAAEKAKHSLDNIIRVKVERDHLKVYYKHEWYHYTPRGTWY